jgi:hypothetical protein
MPRSRSLPELWGTSEVAEALGVHSQNLVQIAGLPAPVQKIRATPLWDASEMKTFSEEYWGRRKRRTEDALKRHAKLVAKLKEAEQLRDKDGIQRARNALARQADILRSKGYTLTTDKSTPVLEKDAATVAA